MKPIIFNGEMVRAILDGRKTQTRRIIKPFPDWEDPVVLPIEIHGDEWIKGVKATKGATHELWAGDHDSLNSDGGTHEGDIKCPYGQVGDRLYVRESWRTFDHFDGVKPSSLGLYIAIRYEADSKWSKAVDMGTEIGKLRRSIHMPKWCSRIHLEITDIRVERVNDITQDDARDEGVQFYKNENEQGGVWRDYLIDEQDNEGYNYHALPRSSFISLWDSINGKKNGCSWEGNPWVWVVEFKRIEL